MTDTTTEKDDVVEEVNPLGMSDDDILNMEEPTDTIESDIDETEIVPEEIEEEEVEESEVQEETEEEEEVEEEEDEEEEIPEEAIDDTTTEVSKPKSVKSEKDKTFSEETEDTTKEPQSENSESKEIDYKAEYERVMAPFRANGRDVKLNNVDDAIRLMQMGSDYHTKMASLKPSMKLLKMLDNNGLLNEDKLSYLIDLDKKNPEAITKLIKDSGIDPLDVNIDDEENSYSPNTYAVSEKEVELDGVLQEIETTESYSRTMDVISNKWDDKSKDILFNEPGIIKIINDHIATGIYDQIDQVIQNERMLGRLNNLSNLEAYKQVGDAIQANGGFNTQQPLKPEATEPSTQNAPVIDAKVKDRKRAASSPKAAASKKVKKIFNPLAMSDEEFEKIAGSEFN